MKYIIIKKCFKTIYIGDRSISLQARNNTLQLLVAICHNWQRGVCNLLWNGLFTPRAVIDRFNANLSSAHESNESSSTSRSCKFIETLVKRKLYSFRSSFLFTKRETTRFGDPGTSSEDSFDISKISST